MNTIAAASSRTRAAPKLAQGFKAPQVWNNSVVQVWEPAWRLPQAQDDRHQGPFTAVAAREDSTGTEDRWRGPGKPGLANKRSQFPQ